MNIVTDRQEWQTIRKRLVDKTIGFVPTMGHLHAGHFSLCRNAKNQNDIVVVSIFVNPNQFALSSDFELYPRTLEIDSQCLSEKEVDYLLVPSVEDIYPDEYQVQLIETELSHALEGKFRPGHFSGMLTVVLKLLNLVQPNHVYFGEKDFQQLLLVKKLVKALFLSVTVVPCPTIRAQDGLALSSRNSRLSSEQKIKAAIFPNVLKNAPTVQSATEQLMHLGFKVDYVEERWGRRLGAIWLDDVRLIDNIALEDVY